MVRFGLTSFLLGGCLFQHTVEVDKESVDVARGASSDVRVLVDGQPLLDLEYVTLVSDDEATVTVLPWTNARVRVGGNLEGETIVHVNVYGQTVDLPTRVGPPALLKIWIEPAVVTSSVGGDIPVQALGFDTLARVVDVSADSRWAVRDPGVAELDPAGMMLHAMREGHTTLHATNGDQATVIPITIFK